MALQHVLPFFSGKRLDTITQDQVRNWLSDRADKNYSPASRNRWLMILRGIFKLAVEKSLIPHAPTSGIRAENLDHKEPEQPDNSKIEELLEFLESDSDPRSDALLLIILTGANKREILEMRWENVNLQNRFLLVKTPQANVLRRIWLSPEAVEIIRKMELQNSEAVNSGSWMFPNENGTGPLCDIFRYWNKVRKNLNLENLRVCDLSRIYALWKIKRGESISYLREVHGEHIFRGLRKDGLINVVRAPVKIANNTRVEEEIYG